MALFALWALHQVEPAKKSSGIGMHLSSGMTVHASHLFLFIVNVGGKAAISTSKFWVHPTTMTAGAGGIHRWLFLKNMPRKKSTINIIRTADVALTAT